MIKIFLSKIRFLYFAVLPVKIAVAETKVNRQLLQFPKNILSVSSLLFFCLVGLQAQNTKVADTAYERVIAGRTEKIINTLGFSNPKKSKKVQNILIQQYYAINAIQDANKKLVGEMKLWPLSKDSIRSLISEAEKKKSIALKELHEKFIRSAKKMLDDSQLEKVKDGMTMGVLPVTWKAYQEMVLNLTDAQKEKIYNWLVEARELAMDEGSSEAKHAVFGKYKGRINNYLSAEGYDMKKEGDDWAKRIKATKENQIKTEL